MAKQQSKQYKELNFLLSKNKERERERDRSITMSTNSYIYFIHLITTEKDMNFLHTHGTLELC